MSYDTNLAGEIVVVGIPPERYSSLVEDVEDTKDADANKEAHPSLVKSVTDNPGESTFGEYLAVHAHGVEFSDLALEVDRNGRALTIIGTECDGTRKDILRQLDLLSKWLRAKGATGFEGHLEEWGMEGIVEMPYWYEVEDGVARQYYTSLVRDKLFEEIV